MAIKRKSPGKSTSNPTHKSRVAAVVSTVSSQPATGIAAGKPIFAEPNPIPDPSKYTVPHASDAQAYAEMDALIKASKFLPLPFKTTAGVTEPILTLSDALGPAGPATTARIKHAGQIVFHSAGDTGATRGPKTENEVIDKMVADFTDEAPAAVPQFFYNLGDIVYSFGEHKYYYDQFYDAFRNYPAPIFAIPGNHDGIVLPPARRHRRRPILALRLPRQLLRARLRAFAGRRRHLAHHHDPARRLLHPRSSAGPHPRPLLQHAGEPRRHLLHCRSLHRQSEVPAAIRRPARPTSRPPLPASRRRSFSGAVLIAVHHPPYSFGKHTGSLVMLKEIDAICKATGVWPHAVLSGHAHNFQRFTRTLGTRQIPFYVIGNGGHGLSRLAQGQTVLRTPQTMPIFAQPEAGDSIVFENYDDKSYGYLRILVNAQQLRIEYHPASDGTSTKTPNDSVTVDLASGTLVHYNPPT